MLSEFRIRVAGRGLEEAALDALLGKLAEEGLVKARGKQRTDSTHVIAAARALRTTELAGESVRAAVEALAAACPDWLAARLCVSDWMRRYGSRVDSWHLPGSKAERESSSSPSPATGMPWWPPAMRTVPRPGRGNCPPCRYCAPCWCRTSTVTPAGRDGR